MTHRILIKLQLTGKSPLIFNYWTLNEHFSVEAYPSFDVRPAFDDYEDGTTSLPRSLVLPLPGPNEERPWLGLVTCLTESGRLQLNC